MADNAHDYARLFTGDDGQFYFTVYARNGEPISQSEGYRHKQDARQVLEDHFPGVRIVEDE